MSLFPFLRTVALAVLVTVGTNSAAQESSNQGSCCVDTQAESQSANFGREHSSGNYLKRFVADQKAVWSSPLKIRKDRVGPLLVLGAGLATLTQVDRDIEKKASSTHTASISRASDAGVVMFAGASGAFYLYGAWKKDGHAREAGALTAEAMINALAVNRVLQAGFRRSAPEESSPGDFFRGGTSFPSNHSAVAWAAASVIAHEYPGWATKALAYGTASAIAAARVDSRKHFTSDVLVGGAVGWLVGEQVYRLHHDSALPGDAWGTFEKHYGYEESRNPMHQGATYVPLDSWTYASYDRLALLGYAPRGFIGMRPWTRTEFARLLDEIEAEDMSDSVQARSLYMDLRAEFEPESRVLKGERNLGVTVDSFYTRFSEISGTPLNDGFHFGQTIVNDYGRPYAEGFNVVSGVSAHAEAGPFAFFVRGEYQYAPSAPGLSDSVRAAVAGTDGLPEAPGGPIGSTSRMRLLDSYVALNLGGWQTSFGKQSLWWGPGSGGDLMFSDNAEPITMLRVSRITPFTLPSVLGWLGGIRSESFLGQLDGYHFVKLGPTFELTGSYDHYIDPQPYIWGQKVSFQPTPNLEFGVSITTVFAGLGRPLTFGTFKHTFSSSGNAQAVEPGDRRTGFDFSYRIPRLRKWLVLYNGAMSEDQPSPIGYPRHSAMNPGIYLVKIPRLHKLDFRAESAYTDLPNGQTTLFYTNTHYAGGYSNDGQIMGHWVGPYGRALQLSSTYWFSGMTKMQFGYRNQVMDPDRLQGGKLQDFSTGFDFRLRPNLMVRTGLQYERWNMPVLAAGTRSNVMFSLQLTYRPIMEIGGDKH